jgi:hypothetical protein
MVVLPQKAADWNPDIANVPGKDIEVVDALASVTIYHLQIDLAKSRPSHTIMLIARLCNELQLASPIGPHTRDFHCLEIQLRARVTHAPSVGL